MTKRDKTCIAVTPPPKPGIQCGSDIPGRIFLLTCCRISALKWPIVPWQSTTQSWEVRGGSGGFRLTFPRALSFSCDLLLWLHGTSEKLLMLCWHHQASSAAAGHKETGVSLYGSCHKWNTWEFLNARIQLWQEQGGKASLSPHINNLLSHS